MARGTDRIVLSDATRVSGLGDFVRDLRRADRRLPKVMQKANKEIAGLVAREAKRRLGRAPGAASGKVRAQAAKGIRPRARQRQASVALLGSNDFAQAFEFGTRYHRIPIRRLNGAYGGRWLLAGSMRRRVYPPWIGNRFTGGDWKDGLHGSQGHLVHPAVAKLVDSGMFAETYARAIDRAMREAFPE